MKKLVLAWVALAIITACAAYPFTTLPRDLERCAFHERKSVIPYC